MLLKVHTKFDVISLVLCSLYLLNGLQMSNHLVQNINFGIAKSSLENIYRTSAIITRGLYIVYPIFEDQKCFC